MRCWFLVILCLLLQISLQADKKKQNGGKNEEKKMVRGYRQAPSRTTPRPSIFALLRRLISETVADANKAAANVSAIIDENFPSVTGNQSGRANVTSGDDFLSIQNVTDILGKNFRSLRRLFNSEWSNAIRDSRKNIARYRKEFRNAIIPYFYPDRNVSTTSKPS